MTEFLITSSLLILVVAALRHLIKGKISLRWCWSGCWCRAAFGKGSGSYSADGRGIDAI